MPTGPNNFISQALLNLTAVERELAATGELPSAAETIRTEAAASIGEVLPAIKGAQSAAQTFAATATPLLAGALSALDGSEPAGARGPIGEVQTSANALGTAVSGADTSLQTSKSVVDRIVQALSAVDSTLAAEIASTNAELHNDQQEVDSLNKTKLYWLALGPFGLLGLAAVIAELVIAGEKVAGIEATMASLTAQVARFAKVKADVELLSGDLAGLLAALQALSNAVDLLTGDISALLADLQGTNANVSAAKAYVLTAQSELATIATETA